MAEVDIKTEGNEIFTDVLVDSSDEIKAIASAIRELLAMVMPGITEVVWSKQKTVGYGVGPKKMSQHFCYIAPQKKHVNLGFFYGADLNDPEELLEGSGKKLRHIKITSLDTLQLPEVKKLIEEASTYLPKLK